MTLHDHADRGFVDLLHLAVITALVRCGVPAPQASEISAEFVDPLAQQAVSDDEDTALRAINLLEGVIIRVHVAPDGSVLREVETLGLRSPRSDEIPAGDCAEVCVGLIFRELNDDIQRTATEHSQGRA